VYCINVPSTTAKHTKMQGFTSWLNSKKFLVLALKTSTDLSKCEILMKEIERETEKEMLELQYRSSLDLHALKNKVEQMGLRLQPKALDQHGEQVRKVCSSPHTQFCISSTTNRTCVWWWLFCTDSKLFAMILIIIV